MYGKHTSLELASVGHLLYVLTLFWSFSRYMEAGAPERLYDGHDVQYMSCLALNLHDI